MVISDCGVVTFRSVNNKLMAAVLVNGRMSIVVPDSSTKAPRPGVRVKVSKGRKLPKVEIDGVEYPSYTVNVHEELAA